MFPQFEYVAKNNYKNYLKLADTFNIYFYEQLYVVQAIFYIN